MISLSALAKKLFAEKSVAIFCHINPDGDTLGSAVAMRFLLLNRGVDADVYCSDCVPPKFGYLRGAESIKTEMLSDKKYTAYLAMDCADLSRLGKFSDAFMRFDGPRYVIDHHVSNAHFGNKNYVENRAADAENVYELAVNAGCEITPEIANALATGIVTDTGNFRHKNVTPNTMRIAASLIEKGADLNEIYYYCFTSQTPARAKLFGLTMSKIRYFAEGKIALITIGLNSLAETGAKADETEGFIDFVMGIQGVEIGISVMETDKNAYKISLRSKTADVNAVAKNFGGGGHILASGCKIMGEYEEVVDRLTVIAAKYIDE